MKKHFLLLVCIILLCGVVLTFSEYAKAADHPYTSITLDEAAPFEVLLTKKDGTKETVPICFGVVVWSDGESSFPCASFYLETEAGVLPVFYDDMRRCVVYEGIDEIKSDDIKSNAAPYWMRLYAMAVADDLKTIETTYFDYDEEDDWSVSYPAAPYNGTFTKDNIDRLLLIAFHTWGREVFFDEASEFQNIYEDYPYIPLQKMQNKIEQVYGIKNADLSDSTVYDVETQQMNDDAPEIAFIFKKIVGAKKNGRFYFELYHYKDAMDDALTDDAFDWGNCDVQAMLEDKPLVTVAYDDAAHITGIYYDTASSPDEKKSYSPGDVDGDGKITSADARLALRASVGLEPVIKADSGAYKAADVDGDGKVTSADARLILRVSVGLEDVSRWKK